jgi:hypothetical protein
VGSNPTKFHFLSFSPDYETHLNDYCFSIESGKEEWLCRLLAPFTPRTPKTQNLSLVDPLEANGSLLRQTTSKFEFQKLLFRANCRMATEAELNVGPPTGGEEQGEATTLCVHLGLSLMA